LGLRFRIHTPILHSTKNQVHYSNRIWYSNPSVDTQITTPLTEDSLAAKKQLAQLKKELRKKFGSVGYYVPHPTGTPTSFELPVYSLKLARQVDTMEIPKQLFGCPIRPDILHRVVVWHLACKRQGTSKAKNRSEVRGSTRKLAKQKGLGIARVGSKKSPIRRGGGIAHAKRPKDWSYTLPRKIRQLGLRCALSAKFAQNQLFIVDNTDFDTHKSKHLAILLKRFKWESAVMSEANKSKNLDLAQRNIPDILYVEPNFLSVYEILRHKYLVLHRNCFPYLLQRCGFSPHTNAPSYTVDNSAEQEL